VTTTFVGRLKKLPGFRLNFEITALISDPGFISEVEEMFEAHFARSRQIEDGEYVSFGWNVFNEITPADDVSSLSGST